VIAVDRLREVDHHGLILLSAIPAARSDSPAKRAEASARLYTWRSRGRSQREGRL